MGRRDCRVGGASSFFLRPDRSLWVLECVVWVRTHVFGGMRDILMEITFWAKTEMSTCGKKSRPD